VFINDNESGLHATSSAGSKQAGARKKPHSQYDTPHGENNAGAHLKRTIMGREVSSP